MTISSSINNNWYVENISFHHIFLSYSQKFLRNNLQTDTLQIYKHQGHFLHTSKGSESLLEVSLDFSDRHLLMSPYVNIPSRKSSSSTTSTQFCWLSCMILIASLRVTDDGTFR